MVKTGGVDVTECKLLRDQLLSKRLCPVCVLACIFPHRYPPRVRATGGCAFPVRTHRHAKKTAEY